MRKNIFISLVIFMSGLSLSAQTVVAVSEPSQVKIIRDGAEVSELPPIVMIPGDELVVAAKHTAVIRYKDSTIISVSGPTRMTINPPQGGAPEIQIQEGSVRADVSSKKHPNAVQTKKHKFFIKTNGAVMGVRGTDFFVDVSKGNTLALHTIEGTVEVAKDVTVLDAGKGTPVAKGQMITADAKSISTPKPFNINEYLKTQVNRYPTAKISKTEHLTPEDEVGDVKGELKKSNDSAVETIKKAIKRGQ